MRRALLVAGAALLLLAAPAAAENPVLDAEGDADLTASLAAATEVQGVCYGYELTVFDADTGQFSGTFAAGSLGAGLLAGAGDACPEGAVVLVATIEYTSSFSEAQDSASWRLDSVLPELTISDVEALGLSARDLLDDGSSERTLLAAVQALPRLAAEQAGRPPVLLEPNTASLPADARPTNTPGSDWLRENAAPLAFFVLLVVAGVVLLLLSRRAPLPNPSSRRPYV